MSILDLPDDRAIKALRAKDPVFYEQFSDDLMLKMIRDLRSMRHQEVNA